MWNILNPFRRVTLTAVLPETDVQSAIGTESDPDYVKAKESAQLRSLLARTQISMIHESLATSTLGQMRGTHAPNN